MKLDQFIRRLRKEAKTNPKKAAVLGLLVLVALYFWSPLMWGMVAGKGPKAPKTDAADLTGFDPLGLSATLPSAEQLKREPAPQHTWEELSEWMDRDPTMAAATGLDRRPDPFFPPREEQEVNEPEEEAGPRPVVEKVTPQSLGIELSATIIGPRRRVAVIGGRAYVAGGEEPIVAEKEGRKYRFRLAEVRSQSAVLEREGERFELTIPEREGSGSIELVQSAN